LLRLWINRQTRNDLRTELRDHDIHIAAFRHYFDLEAADDVDILAKVGFTLAQVPLRHERVVRFWRDEEDWLRELVGIEGRKDTVAESEAEVMYPLAADPNDSFIVTPSFKVDFWETCLDHYALYGIDDLERGQTYSAPQFTERFGSFSHLLQRYGSTQMLRSDLEEVKQHLYVPMVM
jgi:type I restriction enzyme R subunit